MRYYRLQIDTKVHDRQTFEKVTETLGLQPSELETDNNYRHWVYTVDEDDSRVYYDFINNFMNIVEPKFDALAKLGIGRNEISFWFLYGYEQQCNMEFRAEDMKRLGENGISLCICCWEESPTHGGNENA